jgi:hypothetical protein
MAISPNLQVKRVVRADCLAKFFAPAGMGAVQVKLINLEQYRKQEVVDALKALLTAAESGDLQGLAYVVKVGPSDHRAGMVGIYRRFPEKALQATFALERHLCNAQPFLSSR